MSLYRCENCNAVENTALTRYWFRADVLDGRALCSECDPKIGRWHGIFPKQDADEAGYVTNADGYLVSPGQEPTR